MIARSARGPVIAGALLMAVALVTCTASGDEPAAATPDDVAAGLLPAVVLEGEAPAPFTLEERMERYNVPGVSVAVMDDGEIVWARGWGVADVGTGRPVGPTTLFQAASISKPVAALAAMTLVENGTLGLDEPVNDYLSSWRLPDNEFTADSAVTLRGLLTHTAGLTVWGFPGYRKDEPFGDAPMATNAEVLDGLGNTDPVRVYKTPGISWQYSGGGYTVMEQALEDLSGRPFPEIARERVLDPAGMRLSTYEQPLPQARWEEAARGYRADGSEVEGEWHTYPEQAAAGLWTTPTELLTLSAHLRGILEDSGGDGIVSRPTLEAMFAPHREGEEGFNSYGLGFGIQREGDDITFGHGGSNEGFKAQWVVYRDRGDGAVVMTNGDQGSALAAEILRSISATYDWPGYKPRVRAARRPSPEELTAFEGRYVVEGGELEVSVRAAEGVLEVEVPGQGRFTLHADAATPDEFFDLDDGQTVTFERDAQGDVVALVAGGQARLVRADSN
jgi:CubicO group peptidase (beta-lactamase class C family)